MKIEGIRTSNYKAFFYWRNCIMTFNFERHFPPWAM